MACIDLVIEDLLAEFFVIVAAQGDLEKIDGAVFEPAQIVLPPAGIEDHVTKDAVEFFEVVDVRFSRKRRHFLIHLVVDIDGHGKEGVEDLLVGEALRAGLGNHGRRKRGQPFLAFGIEAAPVRNTRRMVTSGDLPGWVIICPAKDCAAADKTIRNIQRNFIETS